MFQGRTVYRDRQGQKFFDNRNFPLDEYFSLHQHVVEEKDWDWDEHQFPSGKFLLITTYTRLESLSNKDEWLKKLSNTDGIVYLNEFLDGHYTYRDKLQWITSCEQIVIHSEMLYEDNRQNVITTYPCFISDWLSSLCGPIPYEPSTNKKDFLCLGFLRDDVPGRQMLRDQIYGRNLDNHGHVRLEARKNPRKEHNENLLGNNQHEDLIPWDLYANCNLEIVPESLFHEGTLMTEKICKPIVAKKPFLCLSNRYFYRDIKQMGFATFDHVIDETWAEKETLEDRANGLVDSLEQILEMGSDNFSELCKPQTEHNRNWFFSWRAKCKQEYFDTLTSFFL